MQSTNYANQVIVQIHPQNKNFLHCSDWLLPASYWCCELFSPLVLQSEDRTVLSFQIVLCSADFSINALYSVLTVWQSLFVIVFSTIQCSRMCNSTPADLESWLLFFVGVWCYLLTVSTCLRTVPSPKNKGFRASTRMRSKYDCQGRCGVPCYNKKTLLWATIYGRKLFRKVQREVENTFGPWGKSNKYVIIFCKTNQNKSWVC